MSEENLCKQKFSVDQWPTSKVTIYPTNASVVRLIEGVKLKVGLNEITISDLTSLADPDSIRVAGTTDNHPARINDLTIDRVANPNLHSGTTVYDSESEEDDDAEAQKDPQSLTAASKALDDVAVKIGEVEEIRASARKELALLEQYVSTVTTSTSAETLPSPDRMKATLELYSSQRAIHFSSISACTAELSKLQAEHTKKSAALEKEKRAFAKAMRGKNDERKKKLAEKRERKREKNEKRPEKSAQVLRVRITIELPYSDISTGGFDAQVDSEHDFQEAKLSLTYTTTSASWTPMYDLRLDTTNPSLSTLTYRAHFTNHTYETWTQASITLSTSQASFGGLNEKIPQMESWRVTAGSKWDAANAANGENGLYSLAEVKMQQATLVQVSRPVWGARAPAGSRTMKRSIAAPAAMRSMSSVYTNDSKELTRGLTRSRAMSHEDKEDEEDADDGATFAPAPQAMLHSLAGSDTYGFTTTYELPTARTIPSSPLVRRHVIAEIPLPSIVFTYIIIPKLKAAAFLKARVTNTSPVPLLPGQAGLTLDGSFMGNLAFPRCAPAETVVLALGIDQSVKVEYERPIVKHAVQGTMLMGKEEVGVFKRTMQITNTKPSPVSLVVLDQVPVPEDERLKVNITYPRGLKNVDDVAKNGVGVEGTGAKAPVAVPAVVAQSKSEDFAETTIVKGQSFSFGKSTLGKSLSSSSSLKSRPAAPTVVASASSETKSTVSGWGTAKASLKKNGEIRWDVDLEKGRSVGLALEWECRMPSGEGVQALS